MPNVIVKEDYLTFGGIKYYRGHAEEIEIGSVGEKRSAGVKHLSVKDLLLVPEKDIARATVVEIDFSRTSENVFKLLISTVLEGGPAKLKGDATFEKLKSGELKLVKFSVLNNAMKRAANNSPKIIRDLIYCKFRSNRPPQTGLN